MAKRFDITPLRKDILKTVLCLDDSYCSFESIRRKMYGISYPRWQIDALIINQNADALIEHGYLSGGFMSGVWITDAGMEAAL
jgi:hypothetical protein